MRKLITFAIAVLGLLACVSSASAQSYTWPADGRSHPEGSLNFNTPIRLPVPANTTTVNIVSSTDSGCDTDIIDTVSVTSGPNPQVGEWIDVPQGFQYGVFKIISATQNADGTWTLVENQPTCEGFPVHTGIAFLGPGLTYVLNFTGPWQIATCNSSASSITASYFDASGNLQTAPSATGTVSCSNSSTDNDYDDTIVTTTGTFSGTTSTGKSFTATFTIMSTTGRYTRNAQSAQWTL